MSIGLSFLGGLADRRKEVIDSQRAAAQKKAETEHRIDLQTAGQIKAQTTIDAKRYKLEAEQLRDKTLALAGMLKRNTGSDASVQDIAIEIGMAAPTESGLASLAGQIRKGLVSVGPRGLKVSSPVTPESNLPTPGLDKIADELLDNPGTMHRFLQGIAKVKNMSIADAEKLIGDMNSDAKDAVKRAMVDTAKLQSKSKQPSLFNPKADAQYNFGLQVGKFLNYDQGSSALSSWTGGLIDFAEDVTFKSPTSANSSVRMPNRPAATTVRADGNSTNSAVYAPPNIGDIVTPPGGVPSKWTNATGDNRLDNPKNWEDPDTGKPRA